MSATTYSDWSTTSVDSYSNYSDLDDIASDGTTWVSGGSNDPLGYKTYPKEIQDWIDEIRKKEFFKGGKEKDWKVISKIAKEWLREARIKGLLNGDLKVKRATDKFVNNSEKMFNLRSVLDIRGTSESQPTVTVDDAGGSGGWTTTTGTSGSSGTYTSNTTGDSPIRPSLDQLADAVIRDAAEEKMNKKEGLASKEASVLSKGGAMLGIDGDNFYVYFPYFHEVVMDKLLEDDEKMGANVGASSGFASAGSGFVGTSTISPSWNIPTNVGGAGGAGGSWTVTTAGS